MYLIDANIILYHLYDMPQATALQDGYVLVSRNQKNFKHFPLTLINSMD